MQNQVKITFYHVRVFLTKSNRVGKAKVGKVAAKFKKVSAKKVTKVQSSDNVAAKKLKEGLAKKAATG
ncbi:MAG: hypothetical protein ACKO96_17195 [Flammeovirgaceae bacterium]